MQSTIVLGWLFLLCCAQSDGPIEFSQRIKYEPEMHQLVEYLRTHKEQVMDYLLRYMESKSRKRMKKVFPFYTNINSYLDQEDIQWYLDNMQTNS